MQAGNVVTGEMVEELVLSGADIIKVGIGPGERGRQGGGVVTTRTCCRLCVHHSQEDGCGVPSTQRCAGMC